jgi:ribosomal protein L1
MDEDKFNMEVRKFLKVVGVTSQREIENAVHAALSAGRLKGSETLKAKMTLRIDAVGLTHEIDGEIALG